MEDKKGFIICGHVVPSDNHHGLRTKILHACLVTLHMCIFLRLMVLEK